MITCAQDLHHLHRQCNHDELSSFFFGHGYTQVQFTASDDHVPHNMIHGVMMHSGPARDNITDLGAIITKKLSSAGSRMLAWIRREYAIEVSFVRCGPVNCVIGPLAPIVLSQSFLER